MAIARRRRIAVVPGDGIGIEVLTEQKQLLALVNEQRKLGLELVDKDWGAERWLKEKVGLPKGYEVRSFCHSPSRPRRRGWRSINSRSRAPSWWRTMASTSSTCFCAPRLRGRTPTS